MELLCDADVEPPDVKSKRVRAWYLYEQFKSLEVNQLEATKKLNDRCYQNRLLCQELTDRRRRRRNISPSQSVPSDGNIRIRRSEHNCSSASMNDVFNFCSDDEFAAIDIRQESEQQNAVGGFDMKEALNKCSNKTNADVKDFTQLPHENGDYQSLFDKQDAFIEEIISNTNFADDIKEELEYTKAKIAENINLQLEVRENVQSLEANLQNPTSDDTLSAYDDKTSTNDDQVSSKEDDADYHDEDGESLMIQKMALDKFEPSKNTWALWARLVSFAYQVTQLNHGNCYYDYSSQLLTAVLACDVLWRGITRICNVLQPYISPVKFVERSSFSDVIITNQKTVKCQEINKCQKRQDTKKAFGCKRQNKRRRYRGVFKLNLKSQSAISCGNVNGAENMCHQRFIDNTASGLSTVHYNRAYQSLSSYNTISLPGDRYSSAMWFEDDNSAESSCCTRVTNPMLKVASHIDSVIQNVKVPF